MKRQWRLLVPGAAVRLREPLHLEGHGHVISKVFQNARAQILPFPLKDSKQPLTLELVATTKIESPVTGADTPADGKRLGLVAKNGPTSSASMATLPV